MCSSSHERTPKLQLAAEQPLTGECCIPPKKYTPHPRRSPSKMVGGAKSHLESNPIPTRDARRAQTKPCAHQDPGAPQETEPDLLECEVNLALGSISMNKAGGGDGVPAKLFKNPKIG